MIILIFLTQAEILQKETHNMKTENECDESSIMKSSVVEDLNDDKRHPGTSLMENEEENDPSINLEPFEYIMNQTKRTK